MVHKLPREQKTACVYKPQGATPLDAVREFKKLHPEYARKTVSYAGRLDPMAEGLLLLLVGQANKDRRRYELLEKTYSFEIFFGIGTDSFDLLGRITDIRPACAERVTEKEVSRVTGSFTGTFTQPYPPYSAARVRGRPLYWYARRGMIDKISIPEHRITVRSLSLTGVRRIPDLRQEIVRRIDRVNGDFRQELIIRDWNSFFENNPDFSPPVFRLILTASGGTYVRRLAHDIGVTVGCPATVFSIIRVSIGDFDLSSALRQ